MLSKEEYIERRKKVLEEMEPNSVMVLFSGCEMKQTADAYFDFVPNTNFFYLTGIKQANTVLLLQKINKTRFKECLVLLEVNPLKVVWTGKMLYPEQAQALSGVEKIITVKADEFYEDSPAVNKFINVNKASKVYLDLEKYNFISMSLTTTEYAEHFGDKVIDAFPIIVNFRMVKSPAEIEEIKVSIHTTRLGLDAVLAKMKPGQYEYQMGALFEYTIRNHNQSGLSFHTIAASGDNGVILHYPDPVDELKDGTLLLLDLGAEKDMYRADITRTYPVNGKFSDLQKKVYQMVLNANKEVQKFMKPGVTLRDCQMFTFEFLKKELLENGFISLEKAQEDAEKLYKAKAKELGHKLTDLEKENVVKECLDGQVKKYYYHGVSHHLGLDVHDQCVREAPLKPGAVITDEPGLYMAEYGIGVRIEDDILITEDGSINLSSEIIKEIADIEKAMKSKR